MHVRPLRGTDELELVAERMRATLVEVLGQQRAVDLYSMDWLRNRSRELRDEGAIFVAVDGAVVGHTIVRMEPDALGLFSTTWVQPEHRRKGVAEALLDRGERWLLDNGARLLATNTSATNSPLIALYERRGYAIAFRDGDMVQLRRDPRSAAD